MGVLDQLLAGGNVGRVFDDFVNRYEQGHPAEGYSDQEVLDRYRDVAHAVPQDQYAQAATEALARLSPEERAQARGVTLPAQVGSDPKDLGRVVTDLHETPGQLTDILSGGSRSSASSSSPASSPVASVLASPLARAALAGIAAMVVKRVVRGSAR